MLRECSGRAGADGAWQPGWDELVVHALHDGDEIEPWETVMTIEGDYSLFCHLETVYLGTLSRAHADRAQRARGRARRARQADPLLPGPPRPPPRADGRRLRRAHRRRDRRLDRRAGLVVGRPRHGHRAARPDRGLRRRHRARGAALRRDARRRDGRDRARRLRQRLRRHGRRGRAGARPAALGRAPRHVGDDGRPLAVAADGPLRPARRQSAARAQRARGARPRGLLERPHRRLGRLQRRPRSRPSRRPPCPSTPTASARR